MPSGPAARVARAVHDEVGAEAADDGAHGLDPRLGRGRRLEVDRGLGAEAACQGQARLFRGAHADDAAGAHLAGCGDGEDADRARALDHHGVAPPEAAGARAHG